MFETSATDFNTKPTTMQQKLFSALIEARFLPNGCCSFNDTVIKILFRINWQ
jgi:hypothetical protein